MQAAEGHLRLENQALCGQVRRTSIAEHYRTEMFLDGSEVTSDRKPMLLAELARYHGERHSANEGPPVTSYVAQATKLGAHK